MKFSRSKKQMPAKPVLPRGSSGFGVSKLGRASVLVVCLLPFLQIQCGKKKQIVQQETAAAYHQLNQLQSDILKKVAAENRYYEGTLKNIVGDVGRTRTIVLDRFLQQQARQFIKRNGASPSADALSEFLESVVTAWKADEATREQLLEGARNAMENNLKKVAADQAKIDDLKTKLQALEKQPNSRARLLFLANYAQGVQNAFESLKKEEAPGDNQP